MESRRHTMIKLMVSEMDWTILQRVKLARINCGYTNGALVDNADNEWQQEQYAVGGGPAGQMFSGLRMITS